MALDPNKTYQIKGSLLIALLAVAGISGSGITALFASGDVANAKPTTHLERVTVRLSTSARNAVVDIIDNELCPVVDMQLGLDGGTCTAVKLLPRVTGNLDLRGVDSDCEGIEEPCTPDGVLDALDLGAQVKLPGSVSVSMP